MRKVCWLLAGLCCLAAPAWAHDFWLQPGRFWTSVGAVTPMTIQLGHGADRETWPLRLERIVLFRSIGPGGVADRRAELRAGPAPQQLGFAAPGTHVLALQTNYSQSDLPALRFNDYLKEEGLRPAQQLRQRTRTTDKPGREIYSRRVKTLVQVGPAGAGPQPHVTRPLGLSLEIVPELNPYAPRRGKALPVRVFYEGRPLAGATVKLTNLDDDAKPVAKVLTNAAGRAVLDVPARGAWLLNVVWTKPLAGDRRGDFDTTFSSLAFGYPPGAAR